MKMAAPWLSALASVSMAQQAAEAEGSELRQHLLLWIMLCYIFLPETLLTMPFLKSYENVPLFNENISIDNASNRL